MTDCYYYNRFCVDLAGTGDGSTVCSSPLFVRDVTTDEALNLAAWLVALADSNGKFKEISEVVLES